jgi:Contractile injection system tube protein
MSGALKRAKLVPYDKAGSTLQTDQAIKFDFNPETLTLKISTGQQQDKSRRGRQQVQSVGASAATLSFDAIFDTTRPKDNDVVADGDLNDDTALDVRKRTKPIADLLAAVPQPGGGSGKGAGGGKTDKSPSRVQFQWGNILFDGVITSHQETFDFFAPSGVPLRSKISLTLSEQNFNYVVNADDLSRATADPAPATARDAATAAGADSLFDLGPSGLSLGFSASASLGLSLDASVSLSAQLGVSAEFGVSLDAGISLSASAAIDVFGSASLSAGGGGGGGDVGQAGLARLAPAAARPAGSTQPPAPWAPDGPVAGSAAAGLAASINAMRAAGAATAPAGGPGAVAAATPLPVRGSPPPALPRSPSLDTTVYSSARLVPQAVLDGDRLPRWQALPGTGAIIAAPMPSARHAGGCGCRRCGGH